MMDLMADDAFARIAAGDTGMLGAVPEDQRRAFADRLDDLIDRHRELWLARNRPGGLEDSMSWLENLRAAYLSGEPDPSWGGWPAKFS